MDPVRLLVAIVNYRTSGLALDAVAAIADEVRARGDTHVVVVDNDSRDGSPEAIAAGIAERGFGDWCTLVPLDRNGGFAAGNNAAVRWHQAQTGALPELVWLLNPDTRAHPGALGALVDFLTAHPRAGICGSRCLWEDGRIWASAFRFHSPRSELNDALQFGPVTRLLGDVEIALPPSDAPRRVDWVSGTSFMITRALIERIGLMDDGYFLYFEETDYCARAEAAGFETWTVPASRVTHIGGQSTGVTGTARAQKRRPRYWFFSRGRFFTHRYGVAGTHLANFLWLTGRPFGRLIAWLRGRPTDDPPHLWRDFLTAYYGPKGLMYRPRTLIAEQPAV